MKPLPREPGERARRTREKILAHTMRVFSERGIRKVTVEELCADMAMSKRTFYRHFGSRDALVNELVTQHLSAALPPIAQNLSSDKPVDEILDLHFDLLIHNLFANVTARMMADIQLLLPGIWAEIEGFRNQIAGIFTELLRRGQSEGSVRPDLDPVVAGKLIQGIVTNLANPKFLLSQDISIGQFAATFRKVLLGGVLALPRGGSSR
ncbi:MAG: TetR/AcrR family transcriptional regulator [bacterium]